jgi:hypothetical protein
MRTTNQILLQLREADRYARAKNPHLRRLSVVLLDNIVELQLWRKADLEFLFDGTTWYNGVREHNHKLRHTVSRNRADLLAFAKKQAWIGADDVHLLRYAHRVRNSFYHEGKWDGLDAELAIRLLYQFVNRHFPIWRGAQGLIEVSPHKPIPIETAEEDATGFCPLMVLCGDNSKEDAFGSGEAQSEVHWKAAIGRILTYRPTEAIQALIRRKIVQSLDEVEYRIRFINESKDIDFTWVTAHRFAVFSPMFERLTMERKRMSASGALNMYLAILDNEEKLLDISDPAERARAFHRLLDAHSFVKDPLSSENVEAWRAKAETIMTLTEGQGIAIFLEMQEDLYQIGRALGEMAGDLDGHIQMLIDEARGK